MELENARFDARGSAPRAHVLQGAFPRPAGNPQRLAKARRFGALVFGTPQAIPASPPYAAARLPPRQPSPPPTRCARDLAEPRPTSPDGRHSCISRSSVASGQYDAGAIPGRAVEDYVDFLRTYRLAVVEDDEAPDPQARANAWEDIKDHLTDPRRPKAGKSSATAAVRAPARHEDRLFLRFPRQPH